MTAEALLERIRARKELSRYSSVARQTCYRLPFSGEFPFQRSLSTNPVQLDASRASIVPVEARRSFASPSLARESSVAFELSRGV